MENLKIRFSVNYVSEKISFDNITDLCNSKITQQLKQKVINCELKLKEMAILHLLGDKIGIPQTHNIEVLFTETKREPPI